MMFVINMLDLARKYIRSMVKKSLGVVIINLLSLLSKLVGFILSYVIIMFIFAYIFGEGNKNSLLHSIIYFRSLPIFCCAYMITRRSYFIQLINLGGKRNNIFFGNMLTYLILAFLISLLFLIIIKNYINIADFEGMGLQSVSLIIQRNWLIGFFALLFSQLLMVFIFQIIMYVGSLFSLIDLPKWIKVLVLCVCFAICLFCDNILLQDISDDAIQLLNLLFDAYVLCLLGIPAIRLLSKPSPKKE